jgi:peroxiredoxin
MNRCLSATMICLSWICFAASTPAAPIDLGEPFPRVPLPAPKDPSQRAYLGLTGNQPFTLDQVKGKVVLVEMLNVLCPHCQKQTAPYNTLFRMLEKDTATRGKVKMLGVAVANSDEQIDDFVQIYDVAFPVVADPRFALHRALRAGPTPFSVYVLRDAESETGVVAGTHLGEDRDMEKLFAYLEELLQMKASEFAALPREKPEPQPDLKPPQPDAEIARRVEAAFAAQGQEVRDFRKLDLPSGRRVYAATVIRDGRPELVFAEVASRSSICDVCHNVHYFYLFDRRGKILAFEPLHLTKYGNAEWNRADVAEFARNVVGRSLSGTWDFDPKVDAVTSATMTSAIIFDSLEQGRQLLEELRAQGLL